MNIFLDHLTEYILSTLENSGFSAYVVGGSLRDLLLGMEIHDTDIATNAFPSQVEKIFKEYTVIETGIKHGTVTLVINHTPYEITTFRTEGPYSDSRRPDNVFFTNCIEEDLKRRDFTVNALAFSKKNGLIDLFCGLDDLKNKVLRAVGNPKKRFSEDALRIMRALRFASVLGFEIEKETKSAIIEYSYLLDKIAVERIYSELMRMAEGDSFDKVLREYYSVFSQIMPEIKLPEIDITDLKKPIFRLAALFETKDDAAKALHRLKADNNTIKKVTMLIAAPEIPFDIFQIKQMLRRYGANTLEISLYRELFYGENGAYKRVKNVMESGECFSLGQLAVNGGDIVRLGYSGSEVGFVLEKLLDNVIYGRLKNTKQALLNAAKNIDKS